MRKIAVIIILILSTLNAFSYADPDSILYSNHIFDTRIKTVQLYKDGWNLSYPIIKLNSNDKLLLSFDLIADQPESFYYTIIHCDKDWKKSDIFPNDYLDGYTDNPVEDFGNSFNTTVNYIHYKVLFPNDRVNITKSGNYIIRIYQQDNPDNPVITMRFIMAEDAVRINATAHRPQMTKDNNSGQQIDFTVNYGTSQVIDPFRNFYASILQNGRWDNAKRNLKPDFTGDNEVKYNSLSSTNIFKGGNEFRYFDIKSIRYQTEYVKKIDFVIPNYNVYLFPSENRENKPYFYWQDFNGKYYIAFQEGKRPDIESDYVYVYFTLPSDQLIPGGNIFVSGALNNWDFNKNNLMKYNADKKEYECTLLLKQGWYNYEYAFIRDMNDKPAGSYFEGNHYETENDYVVLIYYRNPRERYDRVVGTTIVNTLNKLTN